MGFKLYVQFYCLETSGGRPKKELKREGISSETDVGIALSPLNCAFYIIFKSCKMIISSAAAMWP